MSTAQPEQPDPLRVVLADDHPFFRDGLAGVLRKNGIDVVAEVPNGWAAVRATEELAPDVVVMDLNMPGLNGVEAARQLTTSDAAVRVLMLTVSADEADVTEAVLAGAIGYVLKDAPVEELLAGIRAAAAGQSAIAPLVATQLLSRLRHSTIRADDRVDARLTPRELEVLALLAEGKGNQEVGDLLFISASTVRHHITSILGKLQVENRVQAAVRAVRNGIV